MTRRLQPLRGSPSKGAVAKSINWVAPVDGWRTDVPLSELPPNAASTLINFFPETGYIRARNGSYSYASGLTGSVGTLIAYMGASNKLFAVTGNYLYEITGGGTSFTPLLSGLSSSHWSWAQFSNAGGIWILACNGFDAPKIYNGTSWSAAGFTGPANVNNLSVVTVYRERLWFLQEESTLLWFGATDAITGTLQSLNVGDVMRFGGVLVALSTWTSETVNGVIQFLVLISSNGEVIVYQGSDPTNASNWSLMGTFKMSAPLGADRCVYQTGADLAIMTLDGIVPLSQAIALDPAASDQKSMTKKIAPTWLAVVQSIGASAIGWEMCTFPPRRMAVINVPDPGLGTYQLVMNTETLAWTQFNGMAATCWCVWNNELFFGTSGGAVYQADYGSNDNGAPISCLSVGAWTRLSDGIAPKSTTLIGVDLIADGNAQVFAAASFDYNPVTPTGVAGSSGILNSGAQWDIAEWDVDIWGRGAPARLIADASGLGVVFAPSIAANILGETGQPSNCQIIGGAIQVQQSMGTI
jgi:hypothetical protein